MKQLGEIVDLAESTISQYETGKREPDNETLLKISEYFGVTVGYLLGAEEAIKEAPTLTKKDERDVARDLEQIMANLTSADGLMFDGNPMSDEARDSMRAAIELGLKTVKLLNKETYTPKKYKKG